MTLKFLKKKIDQLNKLINSLELDLLKDADKIYVNRLHFFKKIIQ